MRNQKARKHDFPSHQQEKERSEVKGELLNSSLFMDNEVDDDFIVNESGEIEDVVRLEKNTSHS